jgi:hypothetical protein
LSGFDLADPERGIFASVHHGGAAIVFDHEEVVAAGPATGALGGEGSAGRGSLALEGVALDVELTPLDGPLRIAGELTGEVELTLCRAIGALRRDGDETEIACLAVSEQSAAQPGGEVDLRRSIAIAFADGALLGVRAARPAGAAGHGEEEVVAAVSDPEGQLPISEALLSTEYDEDGRHRRANLELWRGGEGPLRVAGTIVCGATVETGGLRVETAFFRWSLEGRPGLGRYEITRAAKLPRQL